MTGFLRTNGSAGDQLDQEDGRVKGFPVVIEARTLSNTRLDGIHYERKDYHYNRLSRVYYRLAGAQGRLERYRCDSCNDECDRTSDRREGR